MLRTRRARASVVLALIACTAAIVAVATSSWDGWDPIPLLVFGAFGWANIIGPRGRRLSGPLYLAILLVGAGCAVVARVAAQAVWPALATADLWVRAAAAAVAIILLFSSAVVAPPELRRSVEPERARIRRSTLAVGGVTLVAAFAGLLVGGSLGVVLIALAAFLIMGWVAFSIGWYAAGPRPS